MYIFNSRIRYSEIGSDGFLTIESLMNYFQDCSTFQSEDSGASVDYLMERNLAWVVNSWQVEINRFPKLGEEVVIGTVPYDIKGFIGYRNFFLDTAKGERLAVANSIWSLMDMEKGMPKRVSEDIRKAYPLDQKLEMEYAPRKIDYSHEGCHDEKMDFVVQPFHLDTNMHVNNAQYISMALSSLMNFHQNECESRGIWYRNIKRLRAEYKKQAHLWDKVEPYYMKRTEDDKQIETVALNSATGSPYCIVEIVT